MAQNRHRRSDEHKVLQWLRIGTVAAGVGAAMVAGQGVAVADTGTDTGPESSDSGTGADTTPPSSTGSVDSPTGPDSPDTAGPADGGTVSTGGSPKVVISAQTTGTKKYNDRRAAVAKKPRHPQSTSTSAEKTSTAAASSSKPPAASTVAAAASTPTLPPQATVTIVKVTPSPTVQTPPVRRLVLGVLGLFGFNPNKSTPNNPLLEALWGTYRRIEGLVANRRPVIKTATVTGTSLDAGVVTVTGSVGAEDANRDPVRYTATNGAHGAVTVTPTGTFTYTPTDPSFTGSDTFTITAADKGLHLHGLFGFLRAGGGHTSTATLTINLADADNVAPVITDHTAGSFTVTDPNGDHVIVHVSQTTKGTVEFTTTPDVTTPGVYTVNYTYTPSFAARLAASYAGTDAAETFTFTADDGTLTSAPLSVTATVGQFTANTVVATVATGNGAYGVAVAPDGKTAYVTNLTGDTVSVIDTTTGTVTATVTVGSAPNGVAFSPDGKTAYVTNGNDDTVSVINTVTLAVSSFTVTGGPHRPAVTPDGASLYLLGGLGLYRIDTVTHAVTIVPATGYPQQLRIAPDGKTVYFTVNTELWAVDTATNTVTAKRGAVNHADGLAISPDGGRAYVGSGGIDFIQVLDLGAAGGPGIVLPSSQKHLAISPDDTRLYATSSDSNTVYVLDTATNGLIATIAVGDNPYGVVVSPDSALAYVANNSDGTVSIVWTGLAAHKAAPTVTVDAGEPDATTGAVLLTVRTADADGDHVTLTVGPTTIGTLTDNKDGTFTYALTFAERIAAAGATPESLTFTVADAHGLSSAATVALEMGFAPNTVVKTIDTGIGGAHNMVITADGKTAYTVTASGRVAVIDLVTNTVKTTFTTGGVLRGLALSPDEKTLWAVDIGTNTRSLIFVINTADNTVAHTITTTREEYAVAFSSNGDFAYVGYLSGLGGAALRVFDTGTLAFVAGIDTAGLFDVAVLPDGSAIYTLRASVGAGLVVIDANTITTITAISPTPPGQSRRIAMSGDGSTIYIANVRNGGGGHVSIIDTASNTVTGTIELPGGAEYMAVAPDNSTLFVSTGNQITVIDVATETVRTIIPFDRPNNIELSLDGTVAYVTSTSHSTIGVIPTGLPTYTPPVAV